MAKIGEEHFSAWLRQGLRELRAAFYPESNVAQPAEYGLYGTKTPGEVAEARREVELEPDAGVSNQESALNRTVREAESRAGHEEPTLSRDRDD